MMTENYCCECDEVVHCVIDVDDFYAHKCGAIKCPNCGSLIMPCNECEERDKCNECPYKNSTVAEAMTEEDFVKWYKENNVEIFELMLNGELGEFYQDIAKNAN